jgi:DNA-binding response OmpR family regulator
MENNQIKVLIVDDDSILSRKFSSILEREHFTVIKKTLSNQLIKEAEKIMPTIMLIDDEIITNAQSHLYSTISFNKNLYQIPYAVITNQYNLQHHIDALEFGATDYFEKSINTKLLTTRIKSLVAKYAVIYPQKEIILGAVTINQASKVVYKNSQPIQLSNREYQILTLLANNPNCTFSQAQILENILGTIPHIKTNTVSVHIYGIRNKLDLKQLITVNGSGYKLELNTI